MTFLYCHIWADRDQEQLPWWALSLIEKLNVTCNTLAGQVITHGMGEASVRSGHQLLLPRESAAVIIEGQKLTSDISEEVCHHLREEEA